MLRKKRNALWDWKIWHCHKRLGGNCYAQGLLTFHFLNGFLLINSFLIPPKHFFPIARLLLWFGFGAISMREAIIDIETWNKPIRKTNPIEGRYRWLAVGVLVSECIMCYKYREGTGNILDNPTPFYIWGPWSFVFIFLSGMWLHLRFKSDATVKYPGINQKFYGKRVDILKLA